MYVCVCLCRVKKVLARLMQLPRRTRSGFCCLSKGRTPKETEQKRKICREMQASKKEAETKQKIWNGSLRLFDSSTIQSLLYPTKGLEECRQFLVRQASVALRSRRWIVKQPQNSQPQNGAVATRKETDAVRFFLHCRCACPPRLCGEEKALICLLLVFYLSNLPTFVLWSSLWSVCQPIFFIVLERNLLNLQILMHPY